MSQTPIGGAAAISGQRIDPDQVVSKAGPVYNVKHPDFNGGAAGDGSTNDQPAIDAAIQAARDNGQGTVFLPKGTYRIEDVTGQSAMELHDDNLTLRGAGVGQTIIKSYFDRQADYYGTNKDAALISAYGTDATESGRLSNVVVEDLEIHIVENFPDASIVGENIDNSHVRRVKVNNRDYLNGGTSGIPIWWGREENETGQNFYNSISDCFVINDATNNPAVEMAGTEYGTIHNIIVEGTTGEALTKVEASRNISVSGVAGISAGDCINLLSTQDCSVVNCDVVSTDGKGVSIGGDDGQYDRRGHTVTANTIRAELAGVKVFSGVKETKVSNNTIIGNTTVGGTSINGTIGVLVNAVEASVTDNIIAGQSLYGIRFEAGVNKTEYGQVNDNQLREIDGPGISMVAPNPAGGAQINNNQIEKVADFSTPYIELVAPGSPTPDSFTINGNVCSRAGNGITLPDSSVNFAIVGNSGATINYAGGTSASEVVANNAEY